MNREEYAKWVDHVANNGLKPPRSIIEDYDNWQNRLMLGRFLAGRRIQEYEPALELLEDILHNHMDEYEKVKGKMEYKYYIEQKVWILRDIGTLYWVVKKDKEQSLKYVREALALSEKEEYPLCTTDRGTNWRAELQLLYAIEGKDRVLEEVETKEAYFKNRDVEGSGYYLFNGYLTLSQIEKSKNNLHAAVDYLRSGLIHNEDTDLDLLEMVWDRREEDLEKAYSDMTRLIQYP